MATGSDSMWDVLDDIEKSESGGGGLIGRVDFGIGYKLFLTGIGQEETFFQFDPMDDKAKVKALEAARVFNEEHGGSSRPQVCVQFRVFKADVLGREVTWKGDRFFSHPLWTPGYKEVVKPALKKAGVIKPGIYWAKIGFADDPSGRQDVKADGNLGPAQIEHIVEIYKSKVEAQKAADSTTAASGSAPSAPSKESNGKVPDGWEAATWEAIVPEIKADIEKRLDGDNSTPNVNKVLVAVAKDYGVTIGDLKSLG